MVDKEIKQLQKNVELKDKAILRGEEEHDTLKKQIERLLEELRDKSDSESFDDEKERVMNV